MNSLRKGKTDVIAPMQKTSAELESTGAAQMDVVFMVISSADGGNVHKEFEPDHELGSNISNRLAGNQPLQERDVEAMPRTLRFVPPKSGNIPEVFSWTTGPYILCPQFRDWLEELEPGRHQFLPLQLRSTRPFKGTMDHGTYYLIVRPPCVEALIAEGTEFANRIVGKAGIKADGSYLLAFGEGACNLDRKAVEGHHFWRLRDGPGWQHMCSADLWRRIREHKYRGLNVNKKCVLR